MLCVYGVLTKYIQEVEMYLLSFLWKTNKWHLSIGFWAGKIEYKILLSLSLHCSPQHFFLCIRREGPGIQIKIILAVHLDWQAPVMSLEQ